jgi:hypothetical protein
MSIKYDPNKKYTWGNEDKFVLSGGEFGLILNTLRSILSTEEAARVLMANRANEVIESLFQKSVEEGVIKESIEQ